MLFPFFGSFAHHFGIKLSMHESYLNPIFINMNELKFFVNKGSSIVISKFLHYTILVTISGKSFFPNNFNIKLTRFEHSVNLG
jgi:hypothetical protein